MIGSAYSITNPGTSGLTLALGQYPGAQLYAEFKNGVYFGADSVQTSASGIVVDVPAGEPTSGGMRVDGTDAPVLQQVSVFGENGYTGQAFGTLAGVTETATHIIYDGTQSDVSLSVRIDTLFNPPVVEGDIVEITYALDSYVQGEVGLHQSHNPAPAASSQMQNSVGTHTVEYTVGSSLPNRLLFQTDNAFIGSILKSSISVRKSSVVPFIGATSATAPITFGVSTNSIPVDATDRVIARLNSSVLDSYILLWREGVTGLIRLESFISGVSQGHVALAGLDDGGEHRFVGFLDFDTGTLDLSGQTAVGVSLPVDAMKIDMGHSAGSDQLGGTITEWVMANGDHRGAWQ